MTTRRRGLLERLGLRAAPIPTPRPTGSLFSLLPSTAPDVTPLEDRQQQLSAAVGWVAAAATLISEDVRSAE